VRAGRSLEMLRDATMASSKQRLATRPDFRMLGSRGVTRANLKPRNGLFGVGPWEVAVIFTAAAVLLGPEGVVQLARQIAAIIRDLQPTIRELASQSSEITEQLNKELGIDEITETIYTAQKEIQDAQDELTNTIRTAAYKAAPPPPPPPPPTMTSLEDLAEKEDTESAEPLPSDEFSGLTPEQIEEFKKPKFWSPRDEADATETAASTTSETPAAPAAPAASEPSEPSEPSEAADSVVQADTSSKIDGKAVFEKAMRLAEETRRKQEEEAATAAAAGAAAAQDAPTPAAPSQASAKVEAAPSSGEPEKSS